MDKEYMLNQVNLFSELGFIEKKDGRSSIVSGCEKAFENAARAYREFYDATKDYMLTAEKIRQEFA